MSYYSTELPKIKNTILLIVDPQVDFHEGGSLAVPGATEDSIRTAAFIREHLHEIDAIYVTLDSHHKLHIAHAAFWQDAKGNPPNPFTIITNQEISEGKWRPKDHHQLSKAKEYTFALERKGRFKLCIWPEHCLIGTPGHNVHPELNQALQEWAGERAEAINYVNKGMNLYTEMYSALAAEVPIPSDPATQFNHVLMSELKLTKRLVVCGQALSHCVNFTVRDIVANWDSNKLSNIIILSDATSSVVGFHDKGNEFIEDMRELGVQFVRTTDYDGFSRRPKSNK